MHELTFLNLIIGCPTSNNPNVLIQFRRNSALKFPKNITFANNQIKNTGRFAFKPQTFFNILIRNLASK